MNGLAGFALIVLLAGCSLNQARDPCEYDQDALLALDEKAFDQDLSASGGGWRAIAGISGCELAAANLLAAYRNKHPAASPIIAWHEGQLRASAGQYEQAIPLLAGAKKPAEQDFDGWNHYVDASVAFLRHDLSALRDARARLAAVPYPENVGMPPLKDGFIEFPNQPGQPPFRMRWPLNIDVVDGLIACFGKPYAEAYGAPSCRPPAS